VHFFAILEVISIYSVKASVTTVTAGCSPEPLRHTDVRRKIKDNWVDWDDHIQAWQRLNAEGQNVIAAIANTRLMAVYVNVMLFCLVFCFTLVEIMVAVCILYM